MSERFQNKYRIESTRLKNWDYGWNASYFVTICTDNRVCFFGDVVDQKMDLNDIGEIACRCWLHIPQQFPFAKLGEYVVMPNHIHGIVVIDKPGHGRDAAETRLIASLRPPMNQSNQSNPPNQMEAMRPPGGITGNKNPMMHDNLSRIIRWFKGRTTFESRKIHSDFTWQSRYHDHIIRNDASFHRISAYIKKNPAHWAKDSLRSMRS